MLLIPAAVAGLEAEKAQIVRRMRGEKVVQPDDVADALGHFLRPEQQVPCMHKIIDPLLAAVKALFLDRNKRDRVKD